MPNWNRIVVGDAFKLSSTDINYYRDLFLIWPFLGFSLGAISNLFSPASPIYRIYGFKLAACAVAAIFLAKERIVLLLGALAYVAVRLSIAIIFIHTREMLVWLLVSGSLALTILRSRWVRDYKPSYARPNGLHVLDLIVGVSGMCDVWAC